MQAQAKPEAAPRGGITASMIVLEPNDLGHGIVLSAAQALDNVLCHGGLRNQCDHRGMKGEIGRVSSPKCHSH